MPPFFKNTTIELHTYNGKDEYGDKIYKLRETIEADIQPLSTQSSMKLFGKILQDTYNLFIDSTTLIYDTDKLVIENHSYEIIGSIEEWNHLLNFKKCIIKKLRK